MIVNITDVWNIEGGQGIHEKKFYKKGKPQTAAGCPTPTSLPCVVLKSCGS